MFTHKFNTLSGFRLCNKFIIQCCGTLPILRHLRCRITADHIVTAGTASKNTISAKELRQAPNDPGERYVWATRLCLNKIPNCTAEDVSEAYDGLIEKSCTAAGIKNDMANLQKKSAQNTKNSRTCLNEISKCVTAAEKCDTNFSKCVDDKIFNNFFATCSSQSTGCTNFIDTVRTEINKSRQSIISATESNVNAIANTRKQARINRFATVNSDCLHNTEYNKCIDNACQNNTNDNCETNQDIAIALCEFYKTACTKIDVLTEQQLQKKLDELIEK